MSTRSTLWIAALLGLFVAGTVNAQQGGKTESSKAGEAAAAARPAANKVAAEDKAPKKQRTVRTVENKLLLDSHGKPIREQYIDSKGEPIKFTDVPLKEAFLCYPSSEAAHSEKEMSFKVVPVSEMPKDYVCTPIKTETHQVLRIMSLTCSKYCTIWTNPPYVTCCS